MSRSHTIECYKDRVALKLDRYPDNVAAEVPVKFQSDWKSLNPHLATPMLNGILWQGVRPLGEFRPWWLSDMQGTSTLE